MQKEKWLLASRVTQAQRVLTSHPPDLRAWWRHLVTHKLTMLYCMAQKRMEEQQCHRVMLLWQLPGRQSCQCHVTIQGHA